MSSNPLVVSLPYNFSSPESYPTEQLANRFNAWRSILKDLVIYFKEYASVQQEIVSQQKRLQQVVGTSHELVVGSSDVETNKVFLPTGNGSIQDIPIILSKFHHMNITNTNKTLKDINTIIIPKLEDLRRDLVVKIKEIKNLQNDFKNNLSHELQATRQVLAKYEQIMEKAAKDSVNSSASSIKSSNHADNSSNSYSEDPYLVKLKLDKQLKKQLNEESYLHQAYLNLQNAGSKLESIILMEVQNYISMFLNLLNVENSSIPDYLIPNFSAGFLSKESNFEWDSYIDRNLPKQSSSINSTLSGTFIDTNIPTRKMADLNISKSDSILNLPIKQGLLERRSKYLKSYSPGYYVLTCEYLHEFKSNDRRKDLTPVMSLSLDSCTVSKHSQDNSGEFKFVLQSKSKGLMSRHNWLFKCNNYQEMIDWYNEIKTLTGLPTAISRARFIEKRDGVNVHQKYSRASSIFSGSVLSRSPKSSIKRPISENTRRLSSTFSDAKSNSPRMAQMINSDGTIITPVDTYEPSTRNKIQRDVEHNHANSTPVLNPNITISGADSKSPQYNSQQIPTQQQQPQQQQLLQQQTQQAQPVQYMTPPVPYMINQNQPQQFYDPVQNQYFQITPIAASSSSDGTPIQPQYFPGSPNPALAVPGNSPRPTSPTYIPYQTPNQTPSQGQTHMVVPSAQHLQHTPTQTDQNQQPLEQRQQQQFGELLPSQNNVQHSNVHSDITDEVSTLQSRVELTTIDEKPGQVPNEKTDSNADAGDITIEQG